MEATAATIRSTVAVAAATIIVIARSMKESFTHGNRLCEVRSLHRSISRAEQFQLELSNRSIPSEMSQFIKNLIFK